MFNPDSVINQEPKITFKKGNPTKYYLKIENAKEPFWLIFNENFHNQWKMYSLSSTYNSTELFGEIISDYPTLKIKEAEYTIRFALEDIEYLFKKQLNVDHQKVNGYANAWYIEPDKLNLGEDFTIVINYWPQSLFYLCLIISSLTILGCMGYLIYSKWYLEKVSVMSSIP